MRNRTGYTISKIKYIASRAGFPNLGDVKKCGLQTPRMPEPAWLVR